MLLGAELVTHHSTREYSLVVTMPLCRAPGFLCEAGKILSMIYGILLHHRLDMTS